MSVSIEKSGPVTTVILYRPEARNAVDRPTVDALAQDFLEVALQNEFERSEESLKVDGLKGAEQFAEGKGRHGAFDKS